MYEAVTEKYDPEQILAGDFPVETEVQKAGGAVKKYDIVSITDDGVVEASAENIASIYGITAEAAKSGESVAVYLTGDFNQEKINFPKGAEADVVKTPLRNIGIFLK